MAGSKASKSECDPLVGEWLAILQNVLAKNGEATAEQARVRASVKALKHSYGKTVADDFGPL